MNNNNNNNNPTLKFWRRIRQLKIDQNFYNRLKQSLKTDTLPSVNSSESAKVRFRKWVRLFDYNAETDEVELRTEIFPPHLVNNRGEPMVDDIELPMKYIVVNPKDRKKWVEMTWSSAQVGSYRGADSIFKRLQTKTIGITRSFVKRQMKDYEMTQIDMAKNKDLVKPIFSKHANEIWQMDLIDMSKHLEFNSDTTFILTIIDHFSKFAWVATLKDKRGISVSKALENIVRNESPPLVIQSDNGSEFLARETQSVLKKYGINQRLSLAYRPQSNGCIERFNKIIKNAVYKYMKDHETKIYIDALPSLLFCYNTTIHSTTKQTPMIAYRRRTKDDLMGILIRKRVKEESSNGDPVEVIEIDREAIYPNKHWDVRIMRKRGSKYLLSVKDVFSDFIITRIIPTNEPKFVAMVLQRIIYRESSPVSIHFNPPYDDDLPKPLKRLFTEHNILLHNTDDVVMDSEELGEIPDDLQDAIYRQNITQECFEKFRSAYIEDRKAEEVEEDEENALRKSVSENIKQKGLKMLISRTKNAQAGNRLQPLEVGDRVRLDSLALKKNRKMGNIQRRSQKMTGWTAQIYSVSQLVTTTDGNGNEMTKYKVVQEGTNIPAEEVNGGGNVSYYRNQIVKISDSDTLVRIGRPKENLNFGIKVGGRLRGALSRDQRREMARLDADVSRSENARNEVEMEEGVTLTQGRTRRNRRKSRRQREADGEMEE